MRPTDVENRSHYDALAEMRRDLEAASPIYRTIAAGTDGSATAQEAVRHAVAIKSRCRCLSASRDGGSG